jgi:hypothetical protein
MAAYPDLREEDGPGRIQLDQRGDDDEERQQDHQSSRARYEIENPLPKAYVEGVGRQSRARDLLAQQTGPGLQAVANRIHGVYVSVRWRRCAGNAAAEVGKPAYKPKIVAGSASWGAVSTVSG